jgi:DNA-directed RNA polymerase subunit RPC12/RpoP
VNDKVYVCSKCSAENSISELVDVEIRTTGWRAVSIVAEKDGKPKVGEILECDTDDDVYSEPDWDFADVTGYHCAECENKTRTLAEAVTLRREVECRSCGFSGEAADHPADCGGELLGLDAPAPLPGQVALELAA